MHWTHQSAAPYLAERRQIGTEIDDGGIPAPSSAGLAKGCNLLGLDRRERGAMNLIRRRFLSVAGATIMGLAASPVVWAQTYPARSVRVIVPFAPGGATDIIARLILQELSKQLGQQFYVENIARCERQHRHRTSRESGTRRLHHSLRFQLPCHESLYFRQAPL